MDERYQSIAYLLAAIPVAGFVLVVVFMVVRYACASESQRRVLRAALRIRRSWRRTAIRVGLSVSEQIGTPGASNARHRVLTPAITVRREAWGVKVEAMTLGRLGLAEFEKAAEYLADAWRVERVSVSHLRPGRLRLRAVLDDPLEGEIRWEPDGILRPVDPGSWVVGVDADGSNAVLVTSNVSGIVVAGLSGYGKTSLLDTRFCQLAPCGAVQFALIDGKGGPDWDDEQDRAFAFCKDDPQQARDILAGIHTLMMDRQAAIRSVLGVKNMWQVGPTPAWPLVVVVIDEAHSFFHEARGTDPQSKRRDALARETVRLVEELVRKGRNVGIQVVLATQKATGDAIPTKIRDNCQVALSFAQRTSEAAVAVLGSDITDFPDAHPRRLQESRYVGVASVVAEGRPGFTLVRTPLVADYASAHVAEETAHLRAEPSVLLSRLVESGVSGR